MGNKKSPKKRSITTKKIKNEKNMAIKSYKSFIIKNSLFILRQKKMINFWLYT